MGIASGKAKENEESVLHLPHTAFRVVLLGDSGTGKSGILSRYTKNEFSDTFETTIGVDFGTKNLTLGDSSYKFQIWDTAGQERFRPATRAYDRRVHGILLVYSVTDRASFDHIHPYWVAEGKQNGTSKAKIFLVGNKIDLHDRREVLHAEGKQLADELRFQFFEISAKENENIDELFLQLVNETSFVNVKRARN